MPASVDADGSGLWQVPMRGRYLSLRLTVDGCQSTLPSAKAAKFPRGWNGAAVPGDYSVGYVAPVFFPADLKVENNQLVAVEITDEERQESGQMVEAPPARHASSSGWPSRWTITSPSMRRTIVDQARPGVVD